jgi:hypothetical protein
VAMVAAKCLFSKYSSTLIEFQFLRKMKAILTLEMRKGGFDLSGEKNSMKK